MPARLGDGTGLRISGFTEARLGDGTVLWQSNIVTTYDSPGQYTHSVDSETQTIEVELVGAAGGEIGSHAGYGGRMVVMCNVSGGESIDLRVGGQGNVIAFDGSNSGVSDGGGFNGGGNASPGDTVNDAGAGGGASDFRYPGTSLTDRAAVAGGGGGETDGAWSEGHGGYPDGNNAVDGGEGGTQTSGGAGGDPGGNFEGESGSLGVGGDGYVDSNLPTGGGGGGYYGGGGGGGDSGEMAGGGGSSYYDNSRVDHVNDETGVETGGGYIEITEYTDDLGATPLA